jgi:condensin complex subunit 2
MPRRTRKTTTTKARANTTSRTKKRTKKDSDDEESEYEDEAFLNSDDSETEITPKRPPSKKRKTSSSSSNNELSLEEAENLIINETSPNTISSNRRSSTGGRKSLGGGGTSALDETVNDDEQEKQQNKKRREMERRRKSMFATTDFISATTTDHSTKATHTLTGEQLDDLFKNCMKLSTENKINVKNTWQLNLIDYIDEVIETTVGENEVSNFQVASCTLDASVKIYSYRVDSVHNETYKVLGGLSRADGTKRKNSEEEEDGEQQENGETTGEASQKKTTRRAKHGTNTLEQNINNLNVKKFEYAYSIEPLYYRTSGDNAQYDVGSADSLLLNNLFLSESCELILDAAKYNCIYEVGQKELIEKPKMKWEEEQKESDAAMETADFGGPDMVPIEATATDRMETDELDAPTQLPTQGLENSQMPATEKAITEEVPATASSSEGIVEPVVSFDKDLIQVTIAQSRRESEEHLASDFGGPGGFDDPADDSDGEEQECLFDVDFGGNDIMPETDGTDEASNGSSSQKDTASQKQSTGLLQMMESDDVDLGNEYAFINSDKIKGNSWAGVDHWTFSKSKAKKSKSKTTSKKKKSTKTIDFLTEPDEVDVKKAFEVDKTDKKSSISMADRTLKQQEKKNNLLPEDVHYDITSLEQPFNLPNMNKKRKLEQSLDTSAAAIQTTIQKESTEQIATNETEATYPPAYDDDMGFGGGGLFDDDDDHEPLPFTQSEDQQQQQLNETMDENAILPQPFDEPLDIMKMIEAPAMVGRSNIRYATRAKKVDVKALKDHIWSDISKQQEQNEDAESEDPKSFSGVVSGVFETVSKKSTTAPQSTRVKSGFEEANVPFCFICLLHLANEQGLEITGKEDLSDFSIRVPSKQ